VAASSTRRDATKLAFGRYEHVGELGHGGSGRVVEVRDHEAGGAHKALKIVDATQAERLSWELSVLTSTAHASLARVHELLRVDVPLPAPFRIPRGAFVLVEERAPGVASDVVMATLDLAARVTTARAAGAKIAGALATLHLRGLAHGDVKPANIVLSLEGETRATLVDLGLSGAFGRGRAAGTMRYLAPEGLVGERSALTDVYALGATLADWLTGETGTRSDSEGHATHVARRAALPPSVPRALASLIEACLADAPEDRPRSAREVARRLGETPDVLALLDATTPAERACRATVLPLVGRQREVGSIAGAIVKSLRDRRAVVVAVRGASGSGRTRICQEAVSRAQREISEAHGAPPTFRELRATATALPREPTVLHFTHDVREVVDGAAALGVTHARTIRDAARVVDAPIVILLETRLEPVVASDIDGDDVDLDVVVGPLAQAPFASLVQALVESERNDTAVVEAYRRATGGLPGRLVRAFATRWSAGEDPRAGPAVQASGDTDLPALSPAARELAIGAALGDDAIDATTAQRLVGRDLDAAVTFLLTRGLAEHDDTARLALHADVARAIRAAVGDAERRRISALLVSSLPRGAGHALALAASGARSDAITQLVALAGDLRDEASPERAASLLLRGMDAMKRTGPIDQALALALADAELAAGRLDAALAALEGQDGVRARIARAEVQRQRGELDAASEALDTITDATEATTIAAMRARIAMARGELPPVVPLPERSDADVPLLFAIETAALTALVTGDPERARTLAASGLARIETATELRAHEKAHRRARLASVLAAVHAALGDPTAANEAFEQSVEAVTRAGQRPAAASFLVNLGIGRIDLGLLGPALTALREGAERLALLGRARDLARALYNVANAAMLAGDRARARQMGERASRDATRAGDVEAAALAEIVLAEVDALDGRPRAGERRLASLLETKPSSGIAVLVRARLATVRTLVFDLEGARAALEGDAALSRAPIGSQIEWELAKARVLAAGGDTATARALAASTLDRLGARGSFELRCRALAVCADTAEADGDAPRARAHLAALRSLLDPALATLDPGERARFRAMHARALASGPDTRATHGQSVAKVLDHARGLLGEPSRRRIAERLVRGARDLAGAEHAFVVERERDGTMSVRAGEGPSGPVDAGKAHLSLSVVSRCLDGQTAIASRDAGVDHALDGGASIHALSVRSVLALPLSGTALPSALYLDDRLRPAAFGDDVIAAVSELASLASIAFENAQRLRRERQKHLLAVRRERGLRASLLEKTEQAVLLARERPEAFTLVAESESMKELVSLATRVAASDVTLLIGGESGTGKELLARFVHRIGSRGSRPFIAENCAAIPDTLLESALFGHARGAFSGATEARRGLFEAADGGTLLLDEVGEMPLAMQAKLLRALSTGEIRPVGSERTKKVDVRVIGATHADLRAMVLAGTFREDLFYRLAVVELRVPPLRERTADVAPLARLFVTQIAGADTPIEPGAMRLLLRHGWPGNVRELENECRRALALDPSALAAANLSPLLTGEREALDDDLDLKRAQSELEQRLVARAMTRSGRNVTQAAKLLGLSRFGLQKMLTRFGPKGA
jgi:serine/threonine-protein kinase PknK